MAHFARKTLARSHSWTEGPKQKEEPLFLLPSTKPPLSGKVIGPLKQQRGIAMETQPMPVKTLPAALSAGPGTQVTSSPNLGRVSSPATWDMDGFAGLMSQVAPQKEDVDNRIVPGSARYDPVTQLAPAVRSFVPRPSFRSPGHERQDTGAKGPQ